MGITLSNNSINALSKALVIFRKSITDELNTEEKDDYENLVNITNKIIKKYNSGDISGLKQSLGGFSRKLSDSFSQWPPEVKELTYCIEQLEKEIL